jgi:AraC-like DNA-binding protein
MQSMKKKATRTRLIPGDHVADFIDTETVLQRNQILEGCGLDHFLIRLPRLKLHTHFYYKFVEDGARSINEHAHQHWEITRIFAGAAEYPVSETGDVVRPDARHYLVMPPQMTHRWSLTKAPLLMNSWQVRIEAEDETGEQTLANLRRIFIKSGFLIPATFAQVQSEKILWQVTGEERNPQIFGSILAGFAQVVIGDLLANAEPWPDGMLIDRHDPEASAESLARRMRVFLDENVENPINLSDLEGHFHYSERHLNRIFHKVHQISIGQYLRQQRMELAKRWLTTTNRSIKDIAFSLGYSTPGQFCRYFSTHTAMTPSQYRESQKQIQSKTVADSVA